MIRRTSKGYPRAAGCAGRATLILVSLFAAGCAGARTDSSPPEAPLAQRADVDLISAPAGFTFHAPIWFPALKKIVFSRLPPSGDAFDLDLASVAADGSNLLPLPLPDEAGCKYTSKTLATVLGDGRLGYVQQCWPGGGDVAMLMAWDARQGVVRPLVSYRLRFQQGPFACSPDLSTCVINDQAGLEESLQRLGPSGLEPLRLPLKRAGSPSWSPDGRWISLPGVSESVAGERMELLDAPRNLYLLSADLRDLRPLVRDVLHPSAAAWSSDSRWLAISFEPRDRTEGLYLVEAATGRLRLVMRGEFGAPAWLPGDDRLVVPVETSRRPGSGRDTGLYVIRLPESWRSSS
jgi:hypothetical protein